jgi:pyrroloquinoline quinone biosynthesis protein B
VRHALLAHNAVFALLAPAWGGVRLDEPVQLDREGHLEARLFPVPGKVPMHLDGLAPNHAETTAGVRITDLRTGHRLVYAPGVKTLDGGTKAELEAAAVSFVDGTFWTEDELSASRPGAPGARAMGHLPISGPDGSLARLAALPGRRLYTHLNNTNPLLDAAAKEQAWVRAAGVEIACDGLELEV